MILAAGHGTRLRPLTESVPKCMVPLGGKPILEYTLAWLVSFGVVDIIINVSHLADVVMEHFGDGDRWGARITYSMETQPLGTAGGVKNASWFFDGAFLVWYGDNFTRCDLARLVRFHRRKTAVATMCLHYRDDVTQSGIVDLGEEDRVLRFIEKPQPDEASSHWVNAGLYVCEPDILRYISDQGTPDFGHHVFPSLLMAHQRVCGYKLSPAEGLTWIDRPEDLRNARLQPIL